MISQRIKTRLVLREAILTLIDRRRAETGDPATGLGAERQVLDLELADLERATVAQESMENALSRKAPSDKRTA
jgi:hypothetical protein